MAEEDTPSDADTSSRDRGKDKTVAGMLGILLGSLGVHHFYLGSKNTGIAYLAVTLAGGVVTCGMAASVTALAGLVEGILLLTFDDDKFEEVYNQNKPEDFDFVFNHM
ncbi:MAG: TM2 domain-containing protein [bacterium]